MKYKKKGKITIMRMMQIEVTKKMPNDDEFIRWSNDAAALVHKYEWEKRTVCPWSCPINVLDVIDQVNEAPQCTYGSKVEAYQLAKGLTKILNAWERQELEGIELKRKDTGKIIKVDPEDVEFFMETGKFEVIK